MPIPDGGHFLGLLKFDHALGISDQHAHLWSRSIQVQRFYQNGCTTESNFLDSRHNFYTNILEILKQANHHA